MTVPTVEALSTMTLVLTAVGSVVLLLFLVMYARLHAFVALMIVSIGAGYSPACQYSKSLKPCKRNGRYLRVFSHSGRIRRYVR